MVRSRAVAESGQTTAEYAIVLGVITLGVVGVFGTLGNEIASLFDAFAGILPD